ncbi:MAG: GYF domain-containing protein [Chthoniobacter sp.]|uniref:GYF domain-containing protein n=1 Tax=Chthoniobacter sp. TaxID=2510640 RepID=UPI0032A6D072
MDYYYTADGTNVLGPTPLGELTTQLSQGGLASTTQVCAVGSKTWQPISSVVQAGSTPPPPPPPLAPPPIPQTGDATGGLIPYKNPHALVGYYLGIFGLMPFIGILLAIPALILGIIGLKKRKQNPVIKGAVHAWIGIIFGAISIAYHALIAVALLSAKH